MKTTKPLSWRDVSPCLPGRSYTAWELTLEPLRLVVVQRLDASGQTAWHMWCDPWWSRHPLLPSRVVYQLSPRRIDWPFKDYC